MPKVIMMCGKICSGKSTHAEALRRAGRAIVLSVDEILLALFGQDAGEKHDEYAARAKSFLYRKSLDILESGADVILDWGFWTKKEREDAKAFYAARGIPWEFHLIQVDDREWQRRIDERNRAVLARESGAYFVDVGLFRKFQTLFEPPDARELEENWRVFPAALDSRRGFSQKR